jgi:C4-dicarboxylate transporter, DctM subunit
VNPALIIAITFAVFFALILLEVPVGYSIAISGTLGIVMVAGMTTATRVMATTPYSATAKYALVVIPMYILLGTLIANAGIGAGIYRAVNRVVSRLPGGLAAAAVVATALFSGISGSSAADVATFGRISVNEMTRHGYDKAYAAAVVASAGAFAALIPPSVTLVIYAIIAEQNVGAMVIAGLIPGVLSAVILVCFVVVRAALGARAYGGRKDDRALAESIAEKVDLARSANGGGGVATVTGTRTATATAPPRVSNRADALAILYAVIIFAIVVGGLYGGIFTATESGAIGAFAALVIALIARRSREMTLRQLIMRSLHETSTVTSMIFLLLIGGAIFAFFIASSGIPRQLTSWATTLPVAPEVVVILFLVLLLVLGMFLDGLSTMLLTVPLIAPVVVGLGFDGIWFGILVLKVIEIGLITPPVGINVFIISGIAKIKVTSVFVKLVPFVALDLVVTAILFTFPDIIMWLPRAAGLAP